MLGARPQANANYMDLSNIERDQLSSKNFMPSEKYRHASEPTESVWTGLRKEESCNLSGVANWPQTPSLRRLPLHMGNLSDQGKDPSGNRNVRLLEWVFSLKTLRRSQERSLGVPGARPKVSVTVAFSLFFRGGHTLDLGRFSGADPARVRPRTPIASRRRRSTNP